MFRFIYGGMVVRWYGGMAVRWYGGTAVRWYGGLTCRWYKPTSEMTVLPTTVPPHRRTADSRTAAPINYSAK